MKVGASLERTRRFTQEEFDRVARLTGDDNPIHVDPRFAASTRFGRTLAHGMFLYGVISGLVAELMPGAIQVEQKLRFPGPTFTGEAMRLSVELIAIDGDTAEIAGLIRRPDGAPSCESRTIVRWAAR